MVALTNDCASRLGDKGASVLPLRLQDVCFEVRGQRLVDHVNLIFERSALTVVVGPNGAGKTLLLKLCHGLIAPTSGNSQWADDIALRDPRAQAMVFHKPVMLRRSVAANVDYVLKICGVARAARELRVGKALELAGLTALAPRAARVLSGGEQQRLALARAWAVNPQVLFLDEPTSNLDPGATRAVEDMIHSIHESGTKIVMTTHDIGQAKRLADEIVFMHHGRVVERGESRVFFERPNTEAAAAFIQGQLLW